MLVQVLPIIIPGTSGETLTPGSAQAAGPRRVVSQRGPHGTVPRSSEKELGLGSPYRPAAGLTQAEEIAVEPRE